MKLSKHRRETLAKINMTPMIDITFLLLIFFMTVTQVSKINKEQLELSQQKGTEEQQEGVVTVNVTKEGQVIVSGNTVSIPALMAIVGNEVAAKGGDPARVKVALRIDRRAECRIPNEIVTALAQLGVQKVNLRVEAPQG